MFKKILVPLDQSSLAEQAPGTAAAIARAAHGEVGLVLAHEMAPYEGFLDSSWRDSETPEESLYIRSMVAEVANGASVTVNGCVETGRAVDVICKRARETDADLIVMTSHGRTGLNRMWLGSVADGVVREATVPVLMLRPVEDKPGRHTEAHVFHRILVALDGSTPSAAILPAAADMAHAGHGTLILTRIVLPVPLFAFDAGLPSYPTALVDEDNTKRVADSARDELTALAQSMEREHGLKVETEVVIAGHVATALLDLAAKKNADLIAMTTHGRGASRLVLGSVADKVLRGGRLPLLLLHPRAARGRRTEPVESAAAANT